ncbi:MAG TPA: helix-turn-helix domain-containing protein [Burkholderiales bacterium]|nr:helix-turn-helix domain-containing protein [Burkholderiales bacterium]
MKRRYLVKLSGEAREQLRKLADKGKAAAYRRRHAQILLKADQGDEGRAWSDKQIAETFEVHRTTVERLRKRFVEHGLAAALERQKRRRERKRVLDGKGEARLIALACQAPPAGQARWTLNLLSERLVELNIVESISLEKVRQALKKLS